jgi:hypothetical protein
MVMPGDTNSFAISPDGHFFAFSATAANGNGVQLWLRPLDSEVARPLAGTESSFIPFWSPDSKSIGFFSHQAMKRIDVDNGAVQTLADAPTPRGGSWNRDGTILFSPAGNGPLYRIPATGGKAEQVTQQRAQDASHRFPQFLPDGHHFLFWVHGPPDVRGVYMGSLDSKEFHRICVADGAAVFVPPNHLLLVRERVLYAQRFDPAKRELAGEPFPVTSGLSAGWSSFMRISVSNTGLIVYRLDETTRRQVTWLDRSGRPVGTVGEPVADAALADLSPDGRTLALSIRRGEGGAHDIMLMDMSRGTLTRLTVEDSGGRLGRQMVSASPSRGHALACLTFMRRSWAAAVPTKCCTCRGKPRTCQTGRPTANTFCFPARVPPRHATCGPCRSMGLIANRFP